MIQPVLIRKWKEKHFGVQVSSGGKVSFIYLYSAGCTNLSKSIVSREYIGTQAV